MGRRSILDESEQDDSPTETDSSNEDETPTSETTDENEDTSESEESGRLQTTLRLPGDLADDLDDWADMRGMSRNAAITYFIAEGLNPD